MCYVQLIVYILRYHIFSTPLAHVLCSITDKDLRSGGHFIYELFEKTF